MTTIAPSTDPISVARTPAGISLTGPSQHPTTDPHHTPSRFVLTMTTRHQIDMFLSELSWPTGPDDLADPDNWLGVLRIDEQRPAECHMAVFLHVDWPETLPVTITAHSVLVLAVDHTSDAVRVELDHQALGRLYDAITACVDDDLPTRADQTDATAERSTDPWALLTGIETNADIPF